MAKNIEIRNCPGTLSVGFSTYSPTAIRRVFDSKKVSHILDFSNDDNLRLIIDDNIGKISISGVQEKFSAIIDKRQIILTPEGMQGRYIIKPAPDYKRIQHRQYMPANEHLTMQIARQVYNIQTAENALIFFQDGQAAYITKRFDINADNSKIKQEDFASLSQKTSETHGKHFKYTGSYTDMGLLFPKYVAAWQVEIVKFFRLVVFNYVFGNGDAHLKNFSLQQTINGDYVLSPAYDLLNSSLHVKDEDFALEGGLFDKEYYSDIYLRKRHPCQDDFVIFGKLIAVPDIQIRKILDEFLVSQPLVYTLTEQSFLDDKLKRMYIRGYEERSERFRRNSQE
ncbi:type II toxin-antitoxin system HipA family toxin [Dysgonomonas sp. HGC4]|uniref:type II toxin-antitoxin system HipA family toxin n=1 Tax=Dysgonomonas sp. HGC4 TaxID=1658009 RepID=UPI000682414D|nr:HipA domain-containing protein [Dysgonomonas sp. HGC4]MBD8347862.1 HipA domain-containing protein [Dysgonomonas sp. HGC4]